MPARPVPPHPATSLRDGESPPRKPTASARSPKSGLGVVHEFPDFLRATTRGCDLRGPLERFIARGDVKDREPAEVLRLARTRARDGAVGRDHACFIRVE